MKRKIFVMAFCCFAYWLSSSASHAITLGDPVQVGNSQLYTGDIFTMYRKPGMALVAFADRTGPTGGNGEYYHMMIYPVELLSGVPTLGTPASLGCDEYDDCTFAPDFGTDSFHLSKYGNGEIFLLSYTHAGPTGGCLCAGDRWNVVQVGRVNNGEVTLGEEWTYINGMNCDDLQHDVCPDGSTNDDPCGDHGQCDAYDIGGDNIASDSLSDGMFVVSWRDFNSSAPYGNSSLVIEVDEKTLTSERATHRGDVVLHGNGNWANAMDANYNTTLAIDESRFIRSWNPGNSINPQAAVGTVIENDIIFGPATNLIVNQSIAMCHPITASLGNGDFIMVHSERQGNSFTQYIQYLTIEGKEQEAEVISLEASSGGNCVAFTVVAMDECNFLVLSYYPGQGWKLDEWQLDGKSAEIVSSTTMTDIGTPGYPTLCYLDWGVALLGYSSSSDGIPRIRTITP